MGFVLRYFAWSSLRGQLPGVARRLLTFFASPKKVSKERRPEVRRPFGFPCVTRNDRPLRNSGSWMRRAIGPVCARPQTVLAECPCRFCVTRRLSSGPGSIVTTIAFLVVPASLKGLPSVAAGTQCVSFAEGCCSSFSCDGMPGVARWLLTFFASPKKVSKERRPQVRRRCAVPCATRNDRPLRNSGS